MFVLSSMVVVEKRVLVLHIRNYSIVRITIDRNVHDRIVIVLTGQISWFGKWTSKRSDMD